MFIVWWTCWTVWANPDGIDQLLHHTRRHGNHPPNHRDHHSTFRGNLHEGRHHHNYGSGSRNHSGRKRIAVCISGQLARWQPRHIFDNLFYAGINSHYEFYLFFNMQVARNKSEIVYNTDKRHVFKESSLAKFSINESYALIEHLIGDRQNIRLASMKYHPVTSIEQFKEILNTERLDRITQFETAQATILNMYLHQVRCTRQIVEFENLTLGDKFDFIASTREDVFFFRPMNLSYHTSLLRQPKSPSSIVLTPKTFRAHDHRRLYFQKTKIHGNDPKVFKVTSEDSEELPYSYDQSQPKLNDWESAEALKHYEPHFDENLDEEEIDNDNFHRQLAFVVPPINQPPSTQYSLNTSVDNLSPRSCDITFKRCLNFWGLNMRFFILVRDNGIKFFGNRMSFYKLLVKVNVTIENPERFELTMANALKLTSCAVSVENMPVTAIRLFDEETVEAQAKAVTVSGQAQSSKTPRRYLSQQESTTGNATIPFITNGLMDKYCFIWFEIDRCVPVEYQEFVRDNFCLELRRRHYISKLAQIYGENHPQIRELINISKRELYNMLLTEVPKKPPLTYVPPPPGFVDHSGNIYEGVPPETVLPYLKSVNRPVTLMRLSLDEKFVDTLWTERDFW